MSNKTYDFLKSVSQYVLPGLSTLYFALASIWNLPYTEQIIGTIAAINTFLGICLGFSTSKYNSSDKYRDGILKIDQNDPEKDIYRLEMNTPLDEVKDKKMVSLRVDSNATLND